MLLERAPYREHRTSITYQMTANISSDQYMCLEFAWSAAERIIVIKVGALLTTIYLLYETKPSIRKLFCTWNRVSTHALAKSRARCIVMQREGSI